MRQRSNSHGSRTSTTTGAARAESARHDAKSAGEICG